MIRVAVEVRLAAVLTMIDITESKPRLTQQAIESEMALHAEVLLKSHCDFYT